MLPNHNNPVHNALFMEDVRAFGRQTGLPENQIVRTWEPGPSKTFLNAMEHRFNRFMIDDLRSLGFRGTLGTTNYWSRCSLYSLPALSEGDIIDVHAYGKSDALSKNPRYESNFLAWIGTGPGPGQTSDYFRVECPHRQPIDLPPHSILPALPRCKAGICR